MGNAIFTMSVDIIVEALHLPAGTVIDFIDKRSNDTHALFGVHHPDIPERKPNELVRKLTPLYRVQTQKVITFDWNMKEKTDDSEI